MLVQEVAFATDVPPDIYAFHRYTRNSTSLYYILACSIECNSQVKPGAFIRLTKPPTRALRPVIPINACTLCITAAAGTELAGASSVGNVKVAGY